MSTELVEKNGALTMVGRTGDSMRGYLEAHAQELIEVSSIPDLNMKKVANVCVELLSKENGRALAECSVVSFFNALKQCIGMGLEPTSSKQFGYFIPYKPEVQFKLSWMGILELARRAGVTARANCVYKDDKFRWTSGIEDEIAHEPNIFAKRDESTLIGVYCVAEIPMPDGSRRRLVEVMSKAEVDEVRKCAAKGSSAWNGFYAEMAKKTVIRRASKSWPLSVDLHDAIARDAEGEFDFSKAGRARIERPEETVAPRVRAIVETEVFKDVKTPDASDAQDADVWTADDLYTWYAEKIVNSKTKTELATHGKAINGLDIPEEQLDQLRNLYKQQLKTVK